MGMGGGGMGNPAQRGGFSMNRGFGPQGGMGGMGRGGMGGGMSQGGMGGGFGPMPQTSGLHPGMGIPFSSHHGGPQMSQPFSVQNSSPPPTQMQPTNGGMSPFGPIDPPFQLPGASQRGGGPTSSSGFRGNLAYEGPHSGQTSGGGGYGAQGNPAGMTGIQNPGAATGAPQSPIGGGGRGQPMTDLFQNPGGQTWDGLSQMDLQGPSGSMGLNLQSLMGMGKNGLNISGLQMGNDVGAGRNGSLWVQDGQGNRMGGVDQMTGKPLPFDLANLDPNGQYTMNWSGAGPGGMRVMGRGR